MDMIQIDKTSLRPIYAQLMTSLRSAIAAGRLAPETRIPEERQLAADLSLSRSTVRRAIVALTKEGLFRRVRGRGTFVAADPGRAVRSAAAAADAGAASAVSANVVGAAVPVGGALRPYTVGIVAPFAQANLASMTFYFRIFQGMQGALAERLRGAKAGSAGSAGAELALVYREVSAPYGEFVTGLNADSRLDAVIILGIADPKLLAALAMIRHPVVLVDSAWSLGGKPVDRVRLDGSASSAAAVTHLLHLGHRDIGLLNYLPDTPAARQRREAYQSAMTGGGVALRADRIYTCECNPVAAYAAMAALFRQPRETLPTAFFCTTDELAVGLFAAAKDAGYSVPQDFSVAGFGDLGAFTWPPLSTVRVPVEAMGAKAIELVERRRVEPLAPVVDAVFPTEFIQRGSCGPVGGRRGG